MSSHFIVNTETDIYTVQEISNDERDIRILLSEKLASITFYNNIYYILTQSKKLYTYNLYLNELKDILVVPFQSDLVKIFIGYDDTLHQCLYYLDNKNTIYSSKLDYYNFPSKDYKFTYQLDTSNEIIEIFQREGIWYIIYNNIDKIACMSVFINDFTLIYNTCICREKIKEVHLYSELLHMITYNNIYTQYNLLNKEYIHYTLDLDNITDTHKWCFGKYITDTKTYTIWNKNREYIFSHENGTIIRKFIFELPSNIHIINVYCIDNSTFNLNDIFKPIIWGLPKTSCINLWNHINIDTDSYVTMNPKDISNIYPTTIQNRKIVLYTPPIKKIVDSLIYGYKNFKINKDNGYGWILFDNTYSKNSMHEKMYESQKIIEIDSIDDNQSLEFGDIFFLYIHPFNKQIHFIPIHKNISRLVCNDINSDIWIAYIAKKEYKVTRLYFNSQV